ncbi:unnamed protein product [Parajaminaea phylloscopi]
MDVSAAPRFNPFEDPCHPSNAWPAWRRHGMLVTLSLMAFTVNYSAGSHLTIFEPMSEYYEVSIAAIANTIGMSILGLGVGAFLWNPLAQAIGHRPVYLIAWTLFVPFNFWLAFSKTYNTFAAGRFFTGFAGSVAQVLPASSIHNLYHPEWRGTAIAFWSLLLILGPPTAPLITSAVTIANPWQYCYYVVIIFAGVVWFLVYFFCGEALYTAPDHVALTEHGPGVASHMADRDEKEIGNAKAAARTADVESTSVGGAVHGHVGFVYSPLKEPVRFLKAMVEPLRMAGYIVEVLPALWGAVAFGWSVGITIIMPQTLAAPPYNFNSVKVGCAFLAIVVGSVLGKIYGGIGSDWTVTYFARRKGDGIRQPEYRLWNMVFPALLLLIGLTIFGYGLGDRMSWWVPIVFGAGIHYIGLVGVTGVLQTYMAECVGPSRTVAAVQLYNFCRATFSFGVPFYIPDWVDLPSWEAGGKGSLAKAYLTQGLMISLWGLAMIALLVVFGKRIRAWQGPHSLS